MAHHTEKVGFPNSPLSAGMKITLEARSPTTDATVAGVTASRWSIYGDDDSGANLTDVVPLYAPADVQEA